VAEQGSDLKEHVKYAPNSIRRCCNHDARMLFLSFPMLQTSSLNATQNAQNSIKNHTPTDVQNSINR
jgi:hypothetical protein